jgi:zinc transporter 5/7
MVLRIFSLSLPVYASMQLGGTRVGLVMLIALALGLANNGRALPSVEALNKIWSSKVATSAVVVLGFITDEAGFTIQNSLTGVVLGYLSLGISILILPPPLPSSARFSSSTSRSTLVRSASDVDLSLVAGALIAVATALAAWSTSSLDFLSPSSLLLAIMTVASMALAVIFSTPAELANQGGAGLALGCLTTASCSFLYSPSLWPGTVCNGGLSALAFLSVLYDNNTEKQHRHHHDHHGHDHTHNAHTHHQHRTEGGYSALTKFILARCEPGSLVYSILAEKDSRRIAYFTMYVCHTYDCEFILMVLVSTLASCLSKVYMDTSVDHLDF